MAVRSCSYSCTFCGRRYPSSAQGDRDDQLDGTSTLSPALHPDTVATAHGPLLTGDAIGDAFDRVRAMAAAPRVMPPGQSALDELIAATVLGRAAA
jgi:hypothetical protein